MQILIFVVILAKHILHRFCTEGHCQLSLAHYPSNRKKRTRLPDLDPRLYPDTQNLMARADTTASQSHRAAEEHRIVRKACSKRNDGKQRSTRKGCESYSSRKDSEFTLNYDTITCA
jgi:hypothetical protein